jgi:hypothetical protein
MDWATFFQDNAQSLFTLGGVFLGSLITFIINYLNLRFQSIESNKDRAEQRRQLEIHAREKWTEHDVLRVMDAIETIIKLISEIIHTRSELTDDELAAVNKEYLQTGDKVIQLVNSFNDKDILKGFNDFTSAINNFIANLPELPKDDIDQRVNSSSWKAVKMSAGKFQYALREKMISIHNLK